MHEPLTQPRDLSNMDMICSASSSGSSTARALGDSNRLSRTHLLLVSTSVTLRICETMPHAAGCIITLFGPYDHTPGMKRCVLLLMMGNNCRHKETKKVQWDRPTADAAA